MLNVGNLYVLKDSYEPFITGKSNTLVINKSKYENIEQVL